MYTHIINPNTGRKVNVLGRQGINILKKYVEALHVMEGGMRGGSGTDSAASKTGDDDAPVTMEEREYLERLGLLQKALFEIRPVCRKPGNEYTPAMLHALVEVFGDIKREGRGARGEEGSIYNEQSFRQTLLKFRAISLFDSINEYQENNPLGIVARDRPRDIIIPFANALRIYGGDEEGGDSLTAPTASPGSGWAAILPDLFKNPSAAINFSKLKACIPQNRTGARGATGHGGGDYLNPLRLFNITAGIERLCRDKNIFINTLRKALEDEDVWPPKDVNDDDDVFSVFSGIDIEVIPSVPYTDAFGVNLGSIGDVSFFAEGSYWYPILDLEEGRSAVWDELSEDFRELKDTHRLLGIYRPNNELLPCKVALIAENTFTKLTTSDKRYIILKMGQPGHYTIGLLDLTNNSIEYFDSEGALAYTPQYGRDDHKTTTMSYGLQAYKEILIDVGGAPIKVDIVTPCTFALQTDDARTNYWEDGYCQSWVWLYIYERLNLGKDAEEEMGEAAETDLVGDLERAWGQGHGRGGAATPTVRPQADVKAHLAQIQYFPRSNLGPIPFNEVVRAILKMTKKEKTLSRRLSPTAASVSASAPASAAAAAKQKANLDRSLRRKKRALHNQIVQCVRILVSLLSDTRHTAALRPAANRNKYIKDAIEEYKKNKKNKKNIKKTLGESTQRDPPACSLNLSFFLNLSWTELLIKKDAPDVARVSGGTTSLINKMMNEVGDYEWYRPDIPYVSSVLALFKYLEDHRTPPSGSAAS